MKQILFNTEMVRAILDGRKTVTRRVIKGARSSFHFFDLDTDPDICSVNRWGDEVPKTVKGLFATFEADDSFPFEFPMFKAPYQVGDVLYVRESAKITGYGGGDKGYYVDCQFCDDTKERFYVPFDEYKRIMNKCEMMWNGDDPYKHPKFSPYWLTKHESRIFLRVTDVKVERLRDGFNEDKELIKEGMGNGDPWAELYKFSRLWDSTINKKDLDKYGWNANPWVWVIEFERIEKGDSE